MLKLLARKPALIVGALQAALALAVSFGLDLKPEQIGAILALSSALLALLLHQSVVSPDTVVEVAGRAATQAVEALGTTTVGAVGTVTDRGAQVIVDTVDQVVGEVGGLVPALAKKATPK